MDESLAANVMDLPPATPKPRRRRWPRILLAVLAFVLLVVAGLGGLVWQRVNSYDNNIKRLPGALPGGDRPNLGVVGTENWLLVGSDSRSATGTTGSGSSGLWQLGQQRSDTIMLLHLPADRKKAYIMSFPRDSWVAIPGHGTAKINAAISYGGPSLLIKTIESFADIRIGHYAAIDFQGFKSMTDALGGVEVRIAKPTTDTMHNITWPAGVNRLDGEKALWFVRQRYNLPGGDFDRIKRQQAFLKALAAKALQGSTLTDPFKLDEFLSAFTKSISMDDTVTAGKLRSLALSLRGIKTGDVSFLTVPVKGTATRDKQSVVLLDVKRAQQLYGAVDQDQMASYIQRFGGTNSLDTVS